MVQRVGWFVSLLTLFVVMSVSMSFAQSPMKSSSSWIDSLKPFYQYVLEHLSEYTPEELKHQQRVRNNFQRKGYSEILFDVENSDGIMALLSYVKMQLHIEYSMLHKTFWIVSPISTDYVHVDGIPFPDDWSFPEDPWKKE